MDELLRDFLIETNESLGAVDRDLVRFEIEPDNADILAAIFRLVHTVKGSCAFIGLPRLEALAHAAETLIGRFRDGEPVTAKAVTLILTVIDRIKDILAGLEEKQAEPEGSDADLIAALQQQAARDQSDRSAKRRPPPELKTPQVEGQPATKPQIASQSIRVNVATLEHLMATVSELVQTRNQLVEIGRRSDAADLQMPLQRLSSVTAELQSSVMKARMQPIGKAWQQLPRLVRDLARDLGKQIELTLQGAEAELDRHVLDLIKDPLTHMVRNSADHGIEPAADRIAAGKPARGVIRLSAYHEGGNIFIVIADDGRGLDVERIKSKAVAKGLFNEAQLAAMTVEQIHTLIFASGFSTAAHVTSLSGRGVGMDVVRSHVEQIGGAIMIASSPGKGMSVTMRIPLTLAIVPALIVRAGAERFAIPQLAVSELVRADGASNVRIERINQTAVLRLRDRLLPLIGLSEVLGLDTDNSAPQRAAFVLVLGIGQKTFGVAVDRVLQAEEIVVKPLAAQLRLIGLFSGSTILGDGAVTLILDPNNLAKRVGVSRAEFETQTTNAETIGGDRTKSLLLFRAGSMQPKAIPLDQLVRIEEIAADAIESLDGFPVMQYRGRLMSLVCVGGARLRSEGMHTRTVLVAQSDTYLVGLVVDSIIDITEQDVDVETTCARAGVAGSAIINGHATDLIDVAYYAGAVRAGPPSTSARPPNEKPAILLVEASEFFRAMLSDVLRSAGYDVSTATCGEDALAMLRTGLRFEAVIINIEMAAADGVATAKAIRNDPALAQTPVIGLSTMVDAAARERGRDAGVDRHLAKFDRVSLISALNEEVIPMVRAA